MDYAFLMFILTAFLGGVISLFSPCSGALLPAYFAYVFQTKQKLLLATFIFFLGLASTTIPIGIGFVFMLTFLTNFGGIFYDILGIVLVLVGIFVVSGKTFSGFRRKIGHPENQYLAIYSLGLFTGLATGTCSGPIIGAIATLASATSSYYRAGILMLFYSLGLVAPLFVFSIFLERFSVLQRVFSHKKLGAYFSGSLLILLGLLYFFLGDSLGRYVVLFGSDWFVKALDFQDKLLLLLYKLQ